MIYAFRDEGDGYYEVDVPEGHPLPEWTQALIPTTRQIPEIVVQVPQTVTRFQARAALHLAGLLPSIEALMADENTPALAKLAWTDAQEFKRTSPTIATMAAALGLTSEQLDQLFITAAEIDA